jgi:hypothetical protein
VGEGGEHCKNGYKMYVTEDVGCEVCGMHEIGGHSLAGSGQGFMTTWDSDTPAREGFPHVTLKQFKLLPCFADRRHDEILLRFQFDFELLDPDSPFPACRSGSSEMGSTSSLRPVDLSDSNSEEEEEHERGCASSEPCEHCGIEGIRGNERGRSTILGAITSQAAGSYFTLEGVTDMRIGQGASGKTATVRKGLLVMVSRSKHSMNNVMCGVVGIVSPVSKHAQLLLCRY